MPVPPTAAQYPVLAAHAARLEALPVFLATPADDTVNVSSPGYRAP
jgi:hypothetical protein